VAITVRDCENNQYKGVDATSWPALWERVRRYAAVPLEGENPWLKDSKTGPPKERPRLEAINPNDSPEEYARKWAKLSAVAALCA
jgi:hypothetical protein